MSLEQRAIRGVPWTVLTYAVNRAILLLTTIALAALLSPADFGVVALATVVLLALALLSDLGIAPAVVIRRDLQGAQLGVALGLMLATGIAAGCVIAAVSPLAGAALAVEGLTPVLAVLSITVPVSAFISFYEAVLQREFEFRLRFFAQLAQALTYASVALVSAGLGAGVWSLVAAQTSATVVHAIVVVIVAPYRARPRLAIEGSLDLWRTGRGFMAQGGIAFARQNADYLAVGRFLGAAPLGFYSMAYRIGSLPYFAIADPIAKVTFPAFTRMVERGEDIRPAYLSSLRLVALVTAPAGIVLSGAAEPFVRSIFGSDWLPMIGPLAVLGLWAVIRPVQVTTGWLLNSTGQAGLVAKLSGVQLIFLAPAVLFAAYRGDITTVAWVMLSDLLISLTVLACAAQRRSALPLRAQWNAVRPIALAAPVGWLAARGVSVALEGASSGLVLVIAAVTGTTSFFAVIGLLAPVALREAVGQVRRVLRRTPARAGHM